MAYKIKEEEEIKTLDYILKKYFKGSKYQYRLLFFEVACRFAEWHKIAKTQAFFIAFLKEYRLDDDKIIEFLKSENCTATEYENIKFDLRRHDLVYVRVLRNLQTIIKHECAKKQDPTRSFNHNKAYRAKSKSLLRS